MPRFLELYRSVKKAVTMSEVCQARMASLPERASSRLAEPEICTEKVDMEISSSLR